MRNISKVLLVKIGVHILIWSMLFAFPYLLLPKQFTVNNTEIAHAWVPVIEYVVIFYINYFFLVDRFVFKRKNYPIFILMNILIIILFRFDGMILQPFRPEKMFNGHYGSEDVTRHKSDMSFMFKNVIVLFVPAIFSVAIKAIEKWSRVDAEKKEIENKNLLSELQNLRYQLQPHFFFNSLNNIYSLIESSPQKAQEAVHSLSKLMRYLLYETSRERIKLIQEVIFIEKYIQLMELRQSDRTETQYTFPMDIPEGLEIAPLLFIPLIENSYKHGVSAKDPSRISFEMDVINEQVIFTSSNNNHPKDQQDKSGSGIGLDNLTKRLQLIYPGKHEFTHEVIDNIFHVILKIDLST